MPKTSCTITGVAVAPVRCMLARHTGCVPRAASSGRHVPSASCHPPPCKALSGVFGRWCVLSCLKGPYSVRRDRKGGGVRNMGAKCKILQVRRMLLSAPMSCSLPPPRRELRFGGHRCTFLSGQSWSAASPPCSLPLSLIGLRVGHSQHRSLPSPVSSTASGKHEVRAEWRCLLGKRWQAPRPGWATAQR